MPAEILQLHEQDEIKLTSIYNGTRGTIFLDENGVHFHSDDGVESHSFDPKELTDVKLYKMEHNWQLDLIKGTHADKFEIKFTKNNGKEGSKELYYMIRSLMLTPEQINEFIDEWTDLENDECKKMFNPYVVARILDNTKLFRSNEVIKAALYGRYAPNLSKHYYGLFVATDKRVLFFIKDQELTSVNLEDLGPVNFTKSFDNYADKHGRSTYVMEFPDVDLHLTFETRRTVKLELFSAVVEHAEEEVAA